MAYLKDPLSKETVYNKLAASPDTPISGIQRKFKELEKELFKEKAYDKLEELGESRELLARASERLKLDIFYYCIPENNLEGKVDRNDE